MDDERSVVTTPEADAFLNPEDYEYAVPNAAALMQSLRAFGYDISAAAADLIDNSITAQADKIFIQFEWNNGNPWISFADNGCGMTERELAEAMKTGSRNPLDIRDEKDLGRFGLGLKSASFSQCRRLTVASKTADGTVCMRCWDLDIVTKTNTWLLLKTASPTAAEIVKKYFVTYDFGTVVIWEKLDRLIPDEKAENPEYQSAFLGYAQSVREHISLVFSSYIHGRQKVQIRLNDRIIEMTDPFMTSHPLTAPMPTETLFVGGAEVTIKAYILPHRSRLTADEFSKNGGPYGWNAQQGFYIYRNNRLISAGGWLIQGLEKQEQYQLARIRIDIGNSTDEEWNIDVRKSTAVPPVLIQKELKRIAVAARRESAGIYRHRGKRLARMGKQEQFFVWHQNIRRGKLGYSINRDHPLIRELLQSDASKQIKRLLTLVEETIPVPMIISDHSEKGKEALIPFEGKAADEYDDILKVLYTMYIESGCSELEAIANIANTEPYIYMREKVVLFCEREGIQYEQQ